MASATVVPRSIVETRVPMKKVLAFAATLSLAASSNFALPTVASADPGNGNVTTAQACQFLAAGFGLSVGNCIQLLDGYSEPPGFTTNANTICHLIEAGQLPPLPITVSNFGECTSYVNALFGKS
jgi:hypothetical protein